MVGSSGGVERLRLAFEEAVQSRHGIVMDVAGVAFDFFDHRFDQEMTTGNPPNRFLRQCDGSLSIK